MTITQLKRGAEIFAKYLGPDGHIGGADHDIIWFAPPDTQISEEDLKELASLGFFISKQYDCWAHHC
jgi:hypothetical protein